MTLPHLPHDVLEVIAGFADIDSRRALGFKPRKICDAVRENMEYLIKRKLASQFKGYSGQTTSLFVTGRKDETAVSAMYIAYHHNVDNFEWMNLLHITGRLNDRNGHTIVGFDTYGITRGISYAVYDPLGASPSCVEGVNVGLGTHVTPYNWEILKDYSAPVEE
jgi:hypothetical protein